MRRSLTLFLALGCLLWCIACAEDDYTLDDQATHSITRIHTQNNYFKDEYGRYLFLHGANVSGSTKLPATVDPISYTGKPFPLDEADANFAKLRDLGFNFIRLLVIWEGVEPEVSGEYDEEYLDYIEQIVAKANDYGIYVMLDMHQDLFSRWLRKYYVDDSGGNALETLPGLEDFASPPFNDVIQGDGAPRWVVQLGLPEKNVGGPQWGLPRSLVGDQRETSDMLPLHWGVDNFLSLDVARCSATFFAGKTLYPNYLVDGKNVQDYLQDSFANAWLQIVKRVKSYPNVLGYDLINEPLGLYVVYTLYALLYQEAKDTTDNVLSQQQVEDQVDIVLEQLRRSGMPQSDLAIMRDLYLNWVELPRSPDEFEAAGFPLGESPYKPDLTAAFGLNSNFNRNFLQPFFSKVGQAVQAEDPDAIIVIESTIGLDDTAGLFGFYITPMLAPEGINQLAFGPHYYADVYPFVLSYNPTPRDFTVDEIRFRDYSEGILGAIKQASFSLGNVPVILGEFGTYFNLGGIEKAEATDFIVPAHIIDNYFDTLEANLINRSIWCYSSENTELWGEGWNREDFSILDANQQPRASDAVSRVTPRFTSGRLVSYKYNSPLAYYDPRPGVPTPYQEFNMEMLGLESSAPTEITIPKAKFAQGFYVYVSDGRCLYDPERGILYWYPYDDDPNVSHTIRIRPPYDDYGDSSWNYYFDGEKMLEGRQ